MALCLVAAESQANESLFTFDIPASNASTGLASFAEQSGTPLIYLNESVRDKQTNRVAGRYTIPQALDILLRGTGIAGAINDRGVLTVKVAEPGDDRGSEMNSTPETVARKTTLLAGILAALTTFGAAGQETEGSQATAPSYRSGTIEEVIVTATKREARLQDVPLSIFAITADEIDRRGLVSAADYLRGIPGVNQVGNQYSEAIVIRGIETTTQGQNIRAGPTTATYFGETLTSASAGLFSSNVDIKLVDIERVEVLRGPQGTAFGNASMGGAVRVIPVAPKLDSFEGKVYAGYSVTSGTGGDNYNFQGVGNIPLIKDKLALRATAYQYQDSGYYRNRAGSDAAFQAAIAPFGGQAFATDEEEVGAYYAAGGRIAALFQASDDLRFTLNYLTQKSETDGFALATSGTYEQTILRVAPEHVRRGQTGGLSDFDIDIANAVVEYDFGWADLLATYSYLDSGMTYAGSFTVFNLPWPASELGSVYHRGHVGEIRLATNFDGAWNFLAGLFAEQRDDRYTSPYVWHGDSETNFFAPGERFLGTYDDRRDLEQQAAFGEVSWEFLPGLTLTGGGRAYQFDRTIRTGTGGPLFGGEGSQRGDDEASGTNFRANLSYKPGDNMLLYTGWAQGFRLGQPQPAAPAGICDTDGDGFIDGTNVTIESTGGVESDAVDSYELGGKFALLDRRLTIDAALFRMEWTDIPVFVSAPACNWTYLANAGEALSEGVEFQAKFQITEPFRVDLGGSWINARLTEDVPSQGFSAGDRLPGSPKVNANLALQYAFEIGGYKAFVRADSIYVGPFYGDVLQSPNTKSGNYVKLDATARVAIDNLNIDLYVRNLTNEDAFTFRGAFPFFGDSFGYRLRPRTVGVQFGYEF